MKDDMDDSSLRLGRFPSVERETWRERIETEIGADAEERLTSRDPDGLRRRPLYTSEDLPSSAIRPSGSNWRIAWRLDAADPNAESVARQILSFGAELLRIEGAGRGAMRLEAIADEYGAEAEVVSEDTLSLVAEHEAGAGPVDECAFLLGALAERTREGRNCVDVETAISSDVFAEIAKLRAMRLLWAKFWAACKVEAPPLRLQARTSHRTRSRVDPWTNLLRAGAQGFAAVVGGADSLCIDAHREAVDDDRGLNELLARRIAVNAQHVLAEEAHLRRVDDPAGGSYYLENLTEQIAREAWDVFREIERGGGLTRRREDGWWNERLTETIEARRKSAASRREVLVGVSDFAQLGESAFPASEPIDETALRLAEPFEALRLRAEALSASPSAALLRFGSQRDARARGDFARRFLAVGGIDARDVENVDEIDEAIVVLCAADADYPGQVPALCGQLADRTIVLAGKPREHEAMLRDAGVAHFIHLGCDAPQILSALLDAS